MDFLIYIRLGSENEDFKYYKIKLCKDQQVHSGLNYIASWRPSTTRILNDDSAFFLSGHVQYKTENRENSARILSEHIKNGEWPLSEDFTGFFSGILFSDDTIRIFNDAIGLFHLYYCITKQYAIISTNLYSIFSITGYAIRKSALLFEITGPEFSQYGRKTVLENVYTLMPGEMLVFNFINGEQRRLFDTTIKTDDKSGTKNLAFDIVDLINSEYKSFYQDVELLMVSISGGIDSRVNLAGLIVNDKKPKLANFGNTEFIDSRIPNKIAQDLGLKIDIVDPAAFQFPPEKYIDEIVRETDSLYINQWIALFEYYKDVKPDYPMFLLGDMCDILRAKGISSLKTRAFRRDHYLSKFFTGKQLKLQPFNENAKRRFISDKKDKIFSNLINSSKNYFNNDINTDFADEAMADLEEFISHLDLYNPLYLESYEELFGIFTHGRRSMGKQLNLLKVRFTPEIPILNLRIIREVLNYSPLARYGDELTNKMFRHPSWQHLGRYATAQNPFLPYNSSLWLMLLGWFIRSSIDQLLLKTYVITKGKFNRQRLVKSRDILSEYNYSGAYDNYKQCFSGTQINPERLLRLFEDRSNRKAWPLSGQDLIPYVQAAWYAKRFRK